jgi:hypothetical protein
VHEGQAEGRKVHLPVFLDRFPVEPVDEGLASWYGSLWSALGDATFRDGHWQLCERSGWNASFENLVAWSWDGAHRWLVVVNLSADVAEGHVGAPWDDLRGRSCTLVDDVNGITFDRLGTDLREGMYVRLDAWCFHLFRVDVIEEP